MSSFLDLKYSNPCDIELIREEIIVKSISGKKSGTVFGAGRWFVNIGLEPQFFAVAKHRLAAHRAKHGNLNTFTLQMPQIVSSNFDPSDSHSINSSAAIGASNVRIRYARSGDFPLKIGRFIKFNNHDKVYQVGGDSDYNLGQGSNVSVTISIIPNLVKAITNSTKWEHDPNLTCRYSYGSRGFAEINRSSVVVRSISVEEV